MDRCGLELKRDDSAGEAALEALAAQYELCIDTKADGADGEAGVIKGYASIFGEQDGGNDIVVRGAFTNSLKTRPSKRIPMLLGHNQTTVPIGVWTVIKEDAKGLYVEGKLAMNSDAGRQMYDILKAGAEMGISIGYRTVRKEIQNANGDASEYSPGAVRKLLEIDLREISLVPIPMLDSARVTGVKHADGGETDPNTKLDQLDPQTKALIRSLNAASETQLAIQAIKAATARLEAK